MKHNYTYVPKSEYMPVKKELNEILAKVKEQLSKHFRINVTYIGSSSRNMITREKGGNLGYDFDVNICICDYRQDAENKYSPADFRNTIRGTIDKIARSYGYDYCEDSTRVLTIKKKDYINAKIISGCDIAIVYKAKGGKYHYIHYDKQENVYKWETMPGNYDKVLKKAKWIRQHKKWDKVRELYLKKKNANEDPNKHSRSIYAETIDEVYKKYNNGNNRK